MWETEDLDNIQRSENIITNGFNSRNEVCAAEKDLKTKTDEWVHRTKPDNIPAKWCDRMWELERFYGLHKENKPKF
jgi:hypothetical protein